MIIKFTISYLCLSFSLLLLLSSPFSCSILHYFLSLSCFFSLFSAAWQFDKLVIDFGTIKNTGPDRNSFNIYFSAILTRRLTKQDAKNVVTIGAEYGKGNFVWVAQSTVTTASLSQVSRSVYLTLEPSSITLPAYLVASLYFLWMFNLKWENGSYSQSSA